MTVLYARVQEYDSSGNVILKPQFTIDPNSSYCLILPNHQLELIDESEVKQLKSGEPFFCIKEGKMIVGIKNDKSCVVLPLWLGRKIRIQCKLTPQN